MEQTCQITFVVPVRNNRAVVGRTLESIQAQTVRDFACLVIDGCSEDGTADFVRDRFPWAKVICKDSDSGPAASRSLGLRASASPFTALVDSDVWLDPAWAEKQLKLMGQGERVGIAGSRLLYRKNPAILCASYGAMNRYGVSWDGGQGEAANMHPDLRRCIWANTSAILVRREVVERSGVFDDMMFAVCEDSDFGWRANIFGFEVVCNPAAIAIHDVHGTFDPRQQRERMLYLLRRNRIRSLLVNYQLSSLLRYATPYLGLSCAELIFRHEKGPLGRAILWNIRHLPATLRRRSEVQNSRRTPDRQLWHLFEPGLRGPGVDVTSSLEASALHLTSSLPETTA